MIIIDAYLESICVYGKSARQLIGAPLSLKKLKVHLTSSSPANKNTIEEHQRLLGILVSEYLQVNPHDAHELDDQLNQTISRLSTKNSMKSLNALRMAQMIASYKHTV